jgi:hypothetical protein
MKRRYDDGEGEYTRGFEQQDTDPESSLRSEALRRIHARRNLAISALWFVLINAMLVFFWVRNGGGFFWPLFPIVFWGLGLFWQAFDAFGRGATEERIQAEMRKLSGGRV